MREVLKGCIGLLLGLALAALFVWWRDYPACEVDHGPAVAAPSGAWSAKLRQEVCSDGFFVTMLFTVVEIDRGNGAPVRDVVRVSESDLARRPVAIAWLGPQQLSVHVPAALGVDMRPFEVPGLALSLSTEAGRASSAR